MSLWKKLNVFCLAKPILGVVVHKDGVNVVIRDPVGIVNGFRQCWEALFRADPTHCTDVQWASPPRLPPEVVDSLTRIVAPTEYDAALQGLAQGSLGSDGIDALIIKALPTETHDRLRESMSYLITHQLPLPALWCQASITLLPKDGSAMNLLNYRPISLLQVMYKLYTSIITK